MPDMITENDEIESDESVQTEPDAPDVAPTERRIQTQSADPTISGLFDRRQEGDLILQPDFQRYSVWDRSLKSRLIESVLLDVPLPIIYLAEEQDGREEVIDGQQRLTAFFEFLNNELALGGLEIRTDLKNKRFRDMDRETQNKVRRATIRTVTIRKESSEDLKYEIFKRLNTGSVALNDQELRNCIYAGPYNRLLRELAGDPDFMYLMGLQNPEKRMRDVELVLRFAAFYHATYLNYKPPVKKFLNDDMKLYRNLSDVDAIKLRTAFKNSVQTVRSLLDRNAFRRYYRGTEVNPNGYWEPNKFNYSLYDVLMWGFSQRDRNTVFPHLDAIRESLIYLMTEDQEFIDAIELSTSSTQAVTARFDKWRSALNQVIGPPRSEPRLFTRALKNQLFQDNPTCVICGQRIGSADDAAVDHIEQYWTGGRTIPENARLTHRFCNWSRPRRDQVAV